MGSPHSSESAIIGKFSSSDFSRVDSTFSAIFSCIGMERCSRPVSKLDLPGFARSIFFDGISCTSLLEVTLVFEVPWLAANRCTDSDFSSNSSSTGISEPAAWEVFSWGSKYLNLVFGPSNLELRCPSFNEVSRLFSGAVASLAAALGLSDRSHRRLLDGRAPLSWSLSVGRTLGWLGDTRVPVTSSLSPRIDSSGWQRAEARVTTSPSEIIRVGSSIRGPTLVLSL